MIFFLFLFNLYSNSILKDLDYTVLEMAYDKANYELLINIAELIKDKEKDLNILKILAKTYLKLNKLDLALENTKLALKLDNNWVEAYKILSFIYYKKNNLNEALSNIKIFDINTSNKTIEEKYYIASLYKELKLDSTNIFIELIEDIEKTDQIFLYIDIYIDALESINNFKKAILSLSLKDDTCDKYSKSIYLHQKANINIDDNTLYNYKKYCNIKNKKSYSLKTSSYIKNIHSRTFDYFNYNLKNEFINNYFSSYLSYKLHKYTQTNTEIYNSLGLGFNYILFNKFNFNIEAEKYFEFEPRFTPLSFNFSYNNSNNNLEFYYLNHTKLFTTKNFFINTIEAKELNLYKYLNYSDFLSFEFNTNYKQVFDINNNYTNIYNNNIGIYSKIKNNNPFLFGLRFNSLYIDNSLDFNNILIKERFICSFIFKYKTNNNKGFNIDTSFIIGDDIQDKDNFLEILELSLNPTYTFNNNLFLNIKISYYSVIEAKNLEYALNSLLSLNYSF